MFNEEIIKPENNKIISDELFEQYYLSGEYINVMPNGIKWKGDFFERQ